MTSAVETARRTLGLPPLIPRKGSPTYASASYQKPAARNSHLYTVLPNGAWTGSRCFIVAGGPSLKGFDFDRLRGERVITINRAFESCPHCTINLSMDNRFWGWLETGQLGGEAKRIWDSSDFLKVKMVLAHDPIAIMPEDVYVVGQYGKAPCLSPSLVDGLSNGRSDGDGAVYHTGHAALNLALCLGANPIYLLGYDMVEPAGGDATQVWFHGGYPVHNDTCPYAKFRETVVKIAELALQKANVVNLNPASGLKCFPFDTFDNLPKISRPMFVSFYTPGAYEKAAQRLEKSLHALGLEHDVQCVRGLDTWQKACQHKADFMLEMSSKYPGRALVWVDADAVVNKYPALFDRYIHDGVHFAANHVAEDNTRHLLSGTLFFGAHPERDRVLSSWIGMCRENPWAYDQTVLQSLLEPAYHRKPNGGNEEACNIVGESLDLPGFNIAELPAAYCFIFDNRKQIEELERTHEPSVIEHFQASRQNKERRGTVGMGVAVPWCNSPTRFDAAVVIKDLEDPVLASMVSIMIPAYNAEKTLARAIESCLAQTYRNIEVIVVDDASSDNTHRVAEQYAERDSRIRVFRHEKNLGEPSARNTALLHSRGGYIARLDADDFDSPKRIEKSVARLQKTPACDCVSCGFAMGTNPDTMEVQRDSPRGMIPNLWIRGFPGGAPCNASIVAKREIYNLTGWEKSFDPKILAGCDSDWNARAILRGARFAHVPDAMYFYWRHSGQITRNLSAAQHRLIIQDRIHKYLPSYDAYHNGPRILGVYPTGACNLNCDYCGQVFMRKELGGFFMSMEDVERMIQRCKDVNTDYSWLEWSGGEPTMWPLLAEACGKVRASGITRNIRVFTNVIKEDLVCSLLDQGLVQQVYTTRMSTNAAIHTRLLKRYPKEHTIHIDQVQFKIFPMKPVANVLPALCNCDRFYIVNNQFMRCGNAYDLIRRFAPALAEPAGWTCAMNEDWISHFRRVDLYNAPHCSQCLANRPVWDATPYPDGRRGR